MFKSTYIDVNMTSTGESTSSSSGILPQLRETITSSIGTSSSEKPKEYISNNPEEITRILFEDVFSMANTIEYGHHLMKVYIDKDAKIVGKLFNI